MDLREILIDIIGCLCLLGLFLGFFGLVVILSGGTQLYPQAWFLLVIGIVSLIALICILYGEEFRGYISPKRRREYAAWYYHVGKPTRERIREQRERLFGRR